MTSSRYALGLDIGGTTTVAALLRDDGLILQRATIPTNSRAGIDDGLARIRALLDGLLAPAHLPSGALVGIGCGATGSIDTAAGCVHNPYTLPGWDDLPLGPYLQTHFDVPCTIMGDCDVAVLGEHWLGAGRAARNVIYVTVGTGIGSGIVIDDRLHRGAHNAACEFGHHTIDALNGPVCYCGARGCIEVVCSGPAIAARAQRAAREWPKTRMAELAGSIEAITAAHVCAAAAQNDPVALAVVRFIATYLGEGLANIMNIVAPDTVVMGGGVMQSWPLFAPVVAEIMQRRESVVLLTRIPIVQAALGLNAGVCGAARAALMTAR
jgi:glucokinase